MVDVNIRQGNGNRILFGFLLLAVLGSNSQMAPVAAGNLKVLEYGTGQVYRYETTVTLNEPAEGKGKDVGYQILADVSVTVLWQSQEDKQNKLLGFELNNPRLLIKSRKAPTPEGFVIHSSNLESLDNSPYVVHWVSGRISEIYIDAKEEVSMINVKRGISSLFQFQLLDMQTKETDASGSCLVVYRTLDPYSFTKTKTDCKVSNDVPHLRSADPTLGGSVNSSRMSTYVLSQDLSVIKSVTSRESHELRVAVHRDIGGSVSALQELNHIDTKANVGVLKSKGMKEALKEFEKSRKVTLSKRHLSSELYEPNCEKEECPSFPKLIKENRDNLSSENMGTLRSATAFFKLLSAARSATKEDLTKAFKGRKNKEILGQLCDLAGAIQTKESHEMITKILNFESEEDLDDTERYLWSLSVGSHPNEYILKDIYTRCQNEISNEKLSETMLLTLASMTNKYHHVPGSDQSLTKNVANFINSGLESCTDDDCKCKYLRALKNLKCPRTIKNLIKYALNGKSKVSVGAMKALRSFDPSHWSEEVIDAAQRIYFEVGKKFDSSSRTLAVDIILESKPSREIIQEMVLSLTRRHQAYEVKMYLLQRIQQISEKCSKFASNVNSVLSEFRDLFNNYNVKAPRGLTTAFTRSVAQSDYRNFSLVSIQEIHRGFLKRGLVDVAVETPEKTTTLFTLGLFAGGLSSFVSSDKQEEEEEDDTVTAGMELTVLGTQLRPFVFFKGQGELMGHVWSGTASEKTPAYQAFIVTEDQLDHISLQNGLMSRLQLLGVVSFHLSGQVQMSLWNRNAHSLVEKSAGMFLQGRISVDTSFVRSKVEFNLATEVKLNLVSDLNFYNEISLCMQLSQPESLIKHNIHKVERIPGSKHRLRKSKYKKISVPGRTYALNRKNNEMYNCLQTREITFVWLEIILAVVSQTEPLLLKSMRYTLNLETVWPF